MAVQNKEGLLISFDSRKLIKRLKDDIKIYGENQKTLVHFEEKQGALIATDYQIFTTEENIDKSKILGKEQIFTAKKLLRFFKEQNSLI